MGRFGFVGPSYTAHSTSVADEECINRYAESIESQGSIVSSKAYGGANALSLRSYFQTPGIVQFCGFPEGPMRGSKEANGRLFVVAGAQLYEVVGGGFTPWGAIANDGNPACIAFNSIQLLIVAGGHAYCFMLASNAITEVTGLLAGIPVQCKESDTYFIVSFRNSNKFQMSQVLDGTTWPGQLVNEVSVFPENITSIIVNHRELWILGLFHAQPYQNTGSAEIYDVIPGALIELGSAATFSAELADNSVFWIGQDERGARMAWRSNGYTPARVSTHAVETDLATYSVAQISGMTSYSYQDAGHLFWVLYIPGSSWSWVYDISEGLWAKRAKWINNAFQAHWGWNHVYAFGKHLIGDWNSGNLYDMSLAYLTDLGGTIRRLRRAPTVGEEMAWLTHVELTIDYDMGNGPQPPLLDGAGKPRPPQSMLRWSDDRGKTWSNEHILNLGFAGQTKARATQRRLGRSRYRVYEESMTDPVSAAIVDAYLTTVPATQRS